MQRALRVPLLLSLLMLACGCNTGSRSDAVAAGAASGATAANTTGATSPTTPASAPTTVTPPGPNTGSRFWYENDAFGNPLKTHNANEAGFAQQVLTLTNAERTAAGLNPLAYDAPAEVAAKAHSEDMQGRNFFDHITPEGWDPGDRLTMTGASGYTKWAENVAFGQQTPAAVVTAWMNSPGHRANILDPDFTHLGVGVAETTPYWTQVFLRR